MITGIKSKLIWDQIKFEDQISSTTWFFYFGKYLLNQLNMLVSLIFNLSILKPPSMLHIQPLGSLTIDQIKLTSD